MFLWATNVSLHHEMVNATAMPEEKRDDEP
jgi:hypothetical protein